MKYSLYFIVTLAGALALPALAAIARVTGLSLAEIRARINHA